MYTYRQLQGWRSDLNGRFAASYYDEILWIRSLSYDRHFVLSTNCYYESGYYLCPFYVCLDN